MKLTAFRITGACIYSDKPWDEFWEEWDSREEMFSVTESSTGNELMIPQSQVGAYMSWEKK